MANFNRQIFFHQFPGVLLLFVFALSIAPRQLLHDIITKHTHSVLQTEPGQDMIVKDGFRCELAGEVVKTPFIDFEDPLTLTLPAVYIILSGEKRILFPAISPAEQFLRGPPAVSYS